jgi:pimeloyl-ACP methyl ester carboxylesterase
MGIGIVYQGVIIGVIATISIDIAGAIFKHLLRLPTADWALVGRWVGHIPRGVFVHHPIGESAAIPGERLIGWIAHYLTGIVYGLMYLGIIRFLWSSDPTLTSALIFGLVTLVVPWFILQPGMGNGVFASKAPRPGVVRLVNLSIHVVFGVSLYAGWLLIPQSETGIATAPDNVPIHYSVYGSGSPALVLVHGISCEQDHWKNQVAAFAQDYRVVTIDLAGHGKSGLGRKDWTMEAYGGDVAAVVNDLGLQDVALIGHSMGGAVIFMAARQLPGRVRALVPVDTFEDFSSWYSDEDIESWVSPFRENYPQAIRDWAQGMIVKGAGEPWAKQIESDLLSAPAEVMTPSMESALRLMSGHDVTTLLEDLDVPVIVINSADGLPPKVESMEKDGVEVHTISGVGHFLMLEDPKTFNSILKTVIEALAD